MEMRGGKLVVCPTPLGNLGDITQRTRDALSTCDLVCAEDCRVTGRLLAALSISKPLERLDEERIAEGLPILMQRVRDGSVVCYCSDAGMPGISDPGQRLVNAFRDEGLPVEVLPGPTAVALAYVASGFVTQGFLFGGFFPRKEGARSRWLERYGTLPVALILYESPRRLLDSLAFFARQLPCRRIAVCRELTKIHEEVLRGSAQDLLETFKEREDQGVLKGEIVIVIDVPSHAEEDRRTEHALDQARARLQAPGFITLGNRDKVRIVREEFGLSRNLAYKLVSESRSREEDRR